MAEDPRPLPCPFCGSEPEMLRADDGSVRMSCESPDCPVVVFVSSGDLPAGQADHAYKRAVLLRWNARWRPGAKAVDQLQEDDLDSLAFCVGTAPGGEVQLSAETLRSLAWELRSWRPGPGSLDLRQLPNVLAWAQGIPHAQLREELVLNLAELASLRADRIRRRGNRGNGG